MQTIILDVDTDMLEIKICNGNQIKHKLANDIHVWRKLFHCRINIYKA